MKENKAIPPSKEDREIMIALIGQVANAAQGSVETKVRTVISRPMWRAWCRAVGVPQNSKPTAWLGIGKTIRVYGSETIVFESDEMVSASTKIIPDDGKP